jgi:hypothetical protein
MEGMRSSWPDQLAGQRRPVAEAISKMDPLHTLDETLEQLNGRYGQLDPQRTAAALHLTC